jgi:septal ring factor EnvC (AmiA/AmiB activator)
MKGIFATVTWLALVPSVVLGPGSLPAQEPSERELARVQAEIADLERDLQRQLGRRDDGMAVLRTIELNLTATDAELKTLGASIAEQSARRSEIARERSATSDRLADEQAALADQARMSYMTGREELIKLLLSQESQADFGRMLVYYDYLNRHRSSRIAAVDAELMRLAELASENAAVRRELERLQAEQTAKAGRLVQEQAERRALIAEMDKAIESSGSRIEQMHAEEDALNETIARLAAILEDFPVNSDAPFAAQRGQLRWPIDGPVAAKFGDKRDGGGAMRWEGVLLKADAGTVVRAVYHGRVLSAQWQPFMGLMLILDHGDGYLSLYGHNAALLKAPGDQVGPGEAIAEVGNSGGQLETGLYFAIFKDAEAVDPAGWIR